jgi:serine protease Do
MMYDEFDKDELTSGTEETMETTENQEIPAGDGGQPEEPTYYQTEETIEEQPGDTSYYQAEETQGESCETETPSGMNHAGVVQHGQDDQNGFYHYSYKDDNQTMPEEKPKKAKKTPQDHKRPLWKSVAVCAGLAVVFGVVSSAAFQVTGYMGGKIAPSETEISVGTADTVAQTEAAESDVQTADAVSVSTSTDITQVAKNAMPSIVAITNKGVEEVQSMFFGQTYEQETESAGSGVIISQNDTELLIATNNHVVDGATELTVCFTVDVENEEDAVVQAQTKGTDSEHDLAVIAVNLSDIPDDVKEQIKVIQIGDSDSLQMGDQVIAIGNALGYGQSLTVGYVSALDREVTIDDVTNNMIQTDAAINFGNSGGALLNTKGELIGINSAKAASEGVEGMGYAIPMATAQPILDELSNRVTRTEVAEDEQGYLGVVPRDVSDEAKEVYNMPAGAFISEVTEGSAADEAGIKKGDIITKLDGQTITSRDDLFDRMDYYKAGETIDVVVATAEGGEYVERTVSVTLGERPADADTSSDDSSSGSSSDSSSDGSSDGSAQDPYSQYGEQYSDPYSQYQDGYGSDGSSSNPFSQFFGNN